MRRFFAVASLLLMLSAGTGVAFLWGKKVSVADLPPVVISTAPVSGDTKVDASLNEIHVTFSKDMKCGGWSLVTITSDSMPESTGDVHCLADKRTFVAPVKLERGHAYAIGVNSEKFKNFQDAGGKPAIPHLLVFETKP